MNDKFNIYKQEYDSKLKIFWIQCFSLLMLATSGSLMLSILNFQFNRFILDILFILSLLLITLISFKKKKLSPYHYLLFIASNLFIILTSLSLEGISKISLLIYFPINVLFTTVLLTGKKRILLISFEILIYIHIIISLVTPNFSDISIYIYSIIQVVILTITLMYFTSSLIHMYDINETYLINDNEKYKNSAFHDHLTKIGNRQYMEDELNRLINQKNHFSVVMFDIDKFKLFNDTYGHQIGDKVLVEFAKILKKDVSNLGDVTRYGGEEFLIILPNATKNDAFNIAEKIRKDVEKNLIIKGVNKIITVSGGVGEYTKKMTMKQLIEIADKNLYIAKERGRNNIKI